MFLQQIGLPVPAVPTLLIAGSLAGEPETAARLLAAAILASVLADWIWYGAGRVFGYRVLSSLCRLSINPGSCVSQTEARFIRWGAWSLVIAKFIPGFSTVAPPIAGSLRMRLSGFLVAAGVGACLWAGLAITAGWLLRSELESALLRMERHGMVVLVTAAAFLALWLGWKLWQKIRFERYAAIPHITPDELATLMGSDTPPLLLDLRGLSLRQESGEIPGARVADYEQLPASVGDWPRDRLVVTLCACPEDAGAVYAARSIMALGYRNVRPLQGGFSAWTAHGSSTTPASAS